MTRDHASLAFVTYEGVPDLAHDDYLTAAALRARGIDVEACIWSDGTVNWLKYDAAILRSTWDYFRHFERFMTWLNDVGSQIKLVNDAAVVRWNAHKKYLIDLEQRGVTIVPTEFVAKGERVDLRAVCRRRNWKDIVVKPSVSGSAFLTKMFSDGSDDDAAAHFAEVIATRDAMVQPYIEEVRTTGERSAVYFDGTFSHAFSKPPFDALPAGTTALDRRVCLDVHERRFCEFVMDRLHKVTTYARVDFIGTKNGFRLMEVELIEPNLLVGSHAPAADAFADAILRQIPSRPPRTRQTDSSSG